LCTVPLDIRIWRLDIFGHSYGAYSPFGFWRFGNFRVVLCVHSLWKLQLGYWKFLLRYTVQLDIGSLGVCTGTYNPFGYSNLEICTSVLWYVCVHFLWKLQLEYLEFSTSLYSPIGNRKFGSLYWDIQPLRLFEFGNLYFCTFVRLRTFPLEIATWIFGIFYFVIQSNWKLEIGSLGVCTLS